MGSIRTQLQTYVAFVCLNSLAGDVGTNRTMPGSGQPLTVDSMSGRGKRTPTRAPATPTKGSPNLRSPNPRVKQVRSPSVRSPSGTQLPKGSPLIARQRPPPISGARFLEQEKLPPSRTPKHPKHEGQGPSGFFATTPKTIDNGHSFILGLGGTVSSRGVAAYGEHEPSKPLRGIAPPELPEGSVHGVNPVQKWQVTTLREQKQSSDIELGSAVQMLGSALLESHSTLHRLVDDWDYTAEQADLLSGSLQNAQVEARSALEFSNLHSKHIEDLRAESRLLSIKEAELDLATSALPWVKHLPPDLKACTVCAPYLVPVVLCRVVRGHCDDLSEGQTKDAVGFLHANFSENFSRRGRDKLAYVPFAEKFQALSEDVDVSSVLGNRCCRNESEAPIEMATSYPWLATMSTATGKEEVVWLKDSMGPKPKADMQLEHVHSYSGSYSKQNLFHLHTGKLLFNSGTICVVHDLETSTQKLFRQHTEFVSAFALFPYQSDNVVASAQEGANPRICIWNTATVELISVLEGDDQEQHSSTHVFPLFLKNGVRSMSFSRDGRRLIALGNDADCSLVIHECISKPTESKWSTLRLLSMSNPEVRFGEKVLDVAFNPYSNMIVSTGVKHMKFWEVHQGGEMLSRNGVFGGEDSNEIHLCCAFLDADTCITGTATGMIWIWKGIRVLQVIAWAHDGPVFDLAIDGRMVLSSGQDMKLCFWNLRKDFRIVPPGKIARGEMLVKELQIADTVRRGNPEPKDRWLTQIGVGCVKSLAWNSHRVFVGTASNHIFVVDDLQHKAALIISGHHQGGMTGVCAHPKIPLVLTSGREGTILVRNLVTKKTVLARNLDSERAAKKYAQSEAVSVVKHKVQINLPTGEEDEEGEDKGDSGSEDEENGKKKVQADRPVQLTCIDICINGVHVAVGQSDGGFAVLTLEYNAQDLVFHDLFAVVPKKAKEAVTCIRISPGVNHLAVGFARGDVRIYLLANLWKRNPGHVLSSGLFGNIKHIDWDDKSRTIRVNDSCNDLKIFDIRTGSEIEYFGACYTVRLKRHRFCNPDHQHSREHSSEDVDAHPEIKNVGLGITRRSPYLVSCVSVLFDGQEVTHTETGYSNEEIQIHDKLIEVDGRAVENLHFDTVKHLLHGAPCKPECGVDCAHSIVEIVLARNRSSNLGAGPGTNLKGYKEHQINVEKSGPFLMEGRWTSSSCPLSWASHRLYLDEYIPGEVLSITRSSSQKMMAVGDVYGKITIMGYPCDPATIVNKDGQKIFCAIEHICFTPHDTYLLVGNEMHSVLTQWKPRPVTEASGYTEKKQVIEPSIRNPDGLANRNLRLILERPLASQSTAPKVEHERLEDENDAFDGKLQWWQNAVPDSRQMKITQSSPCNRELILEHVYGYNGREGKHNVFELMNGDLLYPAGCLCVLNRATGSDSDLGTKPQEIVQYFFVGHTEFVTCLAVHPNGRIIASGDCGPHPLICVWDIESSDWINRSLSFSLASIRGFHRNGISALSFSSDGEYLVSAGEDESHSIAVFNWQKDPLMPFAVYPTGNYRILCCEFNPYAFEFVTCGIEHVCFWGFELNPSAQVERKIFISSIKNASGKDEPDVLSHLLLTRPPEDIAKMSPFKLVKRSSDVSPEFMEWAIHDEENSESYGAARDLGRKCLKSTNLCAAYIDCKTAVTGAMDGKLLVWVNGKLISFVKGHDGPIFDLDCPRSRGSFRGDIMISNRKNEKHFVRVEIRGAGTEDTLNQVAQEALEDWHKDYKRTSVKKRDAPDVKHALIRWEASAPQEFITCGEDCTLKKWGIRLILTVGHSNFQASDLFEKFCTHQPGGHKYRDKIVNLRSFIECLSHMNLLYITDHLHDSNHAYDTVQSSDHIRLSRAEAVRIFHDHNAPELKYGDFISCIERVFNLLGVRSEADQVQLVNLREDLENDIVQYEEQQQKNILGNLADTYDYSILKSQEDIKRIDIKIRSGRISMKNKLVCIRGVQFKRPENDEGSGSNDDCLRAVFMTDNKIWVGTSSNSIYSFDMQTGKWNVRAVCHSLGPINSICCFPIENADKFLTGGNDGLLIMWNGKTKAFEDWRLFSSPVAALDFLRVACILVVGLHDGDIVLLDVSQGTLSCKVAESRYVVHDFISALRCSPDGQWIAVGYESATIRLFEMVRENSRRSKIKLIQHPNLFVGHNGPVKSIDWSVDGKHIQSASQSAGELLYWTAFDAKQVDGFEMSKVKDLAWSTFTSVFGWQLHGAHKHISKKSKLINKDVEPLLGQRVRHSSRDIETIGTLTRISRDKRCDVKWDTNMYEGKVGVANSKLQTVNIGYGQTPIFDLFLVEAFPEIQGHEITWADTSHVIDASRAAFIATGDSGGSIHLFSAETQQAKSDSLLVRQQYAHPGGTKVVTLSCHDKVLYSTGRLDHCLYQWICQPCQEILFSVCDVLRQCASAGIREFFGGLSMLADNLFPENTVECVRKRRIIKDLLTEIKEGLSFGPREIVGVTLVLNDEGKSVPKSMVEDAKKGKLIKDDIAAAISMPPGRIEYCGWERASTDPRDPTFRFSYVHLNLHAAEFDGFGRISSAELFADEIVSQAQDQNSKLRQSMITNLAIAAEKKKAFEMIPDPPLPDNRIRKSKAVACTYSGCEGAVFEKETRPKLKPAGDIGFMLSRTASFEFKFRRLRALIFSTIIRTSVTSVNATKASKEPKKRYRPKKPNLSHQQLVTIYEILDYSGRGLITHGEFMTGLRRNPDFAGLLGLPTLDLQKIASRHIYELRYGDEDLDSSGINQMKEMEMKEFVSFFGKKEEPKEPPACIENAKWTISSSAMKTPGPFYARLTVKGRAPARRRWGQRLMSQSIVPVMTKDEALEIFKELGLGRNESMTYSDFVWLLRRNPHLEEKLGRKNIKAHEIAAFFSDVGMWDPFVGKDVKNQIVPVGVAFQAFQTMDEDGEGFLMVGSFVTGLKRYPAIADSLGLLGRSMRTDALPLIYEYMYGTKNVVASRKVDLIEFVKIFSRADLAHMGLAVPYKPPMRPKMVHMAMPFRVFEECCGRLGRMNHDVSYAELLSHLKRSPEAADSLGLSTWIRESNAALQIFQLMFGIEDFKESRRVTLGDMLRTFSGTEIGDLCLGEIYERDEGPVRPPVISPREAIEAFHEIGSTSRTYITHGELMESLKKSQVPSMRAKSTASQAPHLAKILGFQKWLKEEDASDIIYQIMHGQKIADDGRRISFSEFFKFFAGESVDCFGMATKHDQKLHQKQTLKTIDLELAKEIWEQLDEYDRGFITHGDFWDKLQRLPKIAEALDLTSFVQEEDGSTQLFRILNPGSVKALDNKKYEMAFWIKKFSGEDIGKKVAALNNWKLFCKGVAGLPRWRKFVVRLQLENAALSSVRGILKIKVAQAKATKLALRFLDAIQCPRLLMNDGDDLRVLEVMSSVSFIAAYKGPFRNTHLQLCATHTLNEYQNVQKGLSNWPSTPSLLR